MLRCALYHGQLGVCRAKQDHSSGEALGCMLQGPSSLHYPPELALKVRAGSVVGVRLGVPEQTRGGIGLPACFAASEHGAGPVDGLVSLE